MTKEEFLKLAEEKWEEIEQTYKSSNNFFEYERDFDELWVGFGKKTVEGSLGKVGNDRRKKKDIRALRKDRDA